MADHYRPFKPVFTSEEMKEMCRKTDLFKRAGSSLISHFRPPFTDKLAGKEFDFRFTDGIRLRYRFLEKHVLEWSENGSDYTKEDYEALESTIENVIMVHHIRHETCPYQGLTIIVDLDAELVTWVDLNFGTEISDKNVRFEYHFGYYNDPKPTHGYTEELCGVILDWKYSDDFIIRHAYISPWAMTSPGEPTDNEEEYLFRKTLPATYAKIRDGLYTVSFAEDDGSEATLLIDLKRQRDVGAFYSMSDKGQLGSYMIGAVAGRGKFGFTGEFSIEYGPEGPKL